MPEGILISLLVFWMSSWKVYILFQAKGTTLSLMT